MAGKASNFSDLIQQVAGSCLLHPLVAGPYDSCDSSVNKPSGDKEDEIYEHDAGDEHDGKEEDEDDEVIDEGGLGVMIGEDRGSTKVNEVVEIEMAMKEVLDTVAAMKKAYVSLQETHIPWDPKKLKAADAAVVGQVNLVERLTAFNDVPNKEDDDEE